MSRKTLKTIATLAAVPATAAVIPATNGASIDRGAAAVIPATSAAPPCPPSRCPRSRDTESCRSPTPGPRRPARGWRSVRASRPWWWRKSRSSSELYAAWALSSSISSNCAPSSAPRRAVVALLQGIEPFEHVVGLRDFRVGPAPALDRWEPRRASRSGSGTQRWQSASPAHNRREMHAQPTRRSESAGATRKGAAVAPRQARSPERDVLPDA